MNVDSKKILFITHMHFHPPKNGGHLRTYHILKNLRGIAKVYLISPLSNEQIHASDALNYIQPIRIEKSLFLNLLRTIQNMRIGAFMIRQIEYIISLVIYGNRSEALFSLQGYFLQIFAVKEVANVRPQIVIFDTLRILPLKKYWKKRFPNIQIILNVHNIEHILIAQRIKQSFDYPAYLLQSQRTFSYLEQHLALFFDSVLACSKEDIETLRSLNSEKLSYFLLANGTDPYEIVFTSDNIDKRKYNLLFCGSLNYYPNIEGIEWFIREVFRPLYSENPLFKFYIVGRQPSKELAERLTKESGVEFIGEVKSVVPWYRQCLVSVVPLWSGSGTRLKILEAMAFGCIVLTTPQGAEGIEAEHEKDLYFCKNKLEFIDRIKSISAMSEEKCITFLKQARQQVEIKYDWQNIVKDTFNQI